MISWHFAKAKCLISGFPPWNCDAFRNSNYFSGVEIPVRYKFYMAAAVEAEWAGVFSNKSEGVGA